MFFNFRGSLKKNWGLTEIFLVLGAHWKSIGGSLKSFFSIVGSMKKYWGLIDKFFSF